MKAVLGSFNLTPCDGPKPQKFEQVSVKTKMEKPKLKFSFFRPNRTRVLAVNSENSFVAGNPIVLNPQISQLLAEYLIDGEQAATDKAKKYTFQSKYQMTGSVLGAGSAATVHKCCCVDSEDFCALKEIKKATSDNQHMMDMNTEISVLRKLSHRNVVLLLDVFETEQALLIVTPFYSGGNLLEKMLKSGSFSEENSIFITNQVLAAVAHCHNHGIAHRDIKPENIMLQSPDSLDVVLIDFGLSKQLSCHAEEIMKLYTLVGTTHYVAPEILSKRLPYSQKCDSWSIGVLFYTLLCAFNPFRGRDNNETYELIKSQEVQFPYPAWTTISVAAKRFLCSLLNKEPAGRLSVHEARCYFEY